MIHETAKIHPTAIIYPGVKIGANVEIGAYCIIGAKAEDKKNWNKENKYSVEIGDRTIITGGVTIDAGTITNTRIGYECFIMKGCHIGHDAHIGSGVTMSPKSIVGGHTVVEWDTNIGMGAIIHQRCRVRHGCMIGMGAIVTKKTEELANAVFVGNPAKFLRWQKR